MKVPHKHAHLIKAWADGAVIEFYSEYARTWMTCAHNTPSWREDTKYRVQIEDVIVRKRASVHRIDNHVHSNLELAFDGETGALKSAKVIQ